MKHLAFFCDVSLVTKDVVSLLKPAIVQLFSKSLWDLGAGGCVTRDFS